MNLFRPSFRSFKSGFSAVETILSVSIFVMFGLSIYGGYSKILSAIETERMKSTATALVNEQFELIHNMPYADVGITTGIPVGKLSATQSIVRSGITFIASTTVRNIDDPFDGQIGSTTANDLAPADYKLVEIDISCPTCKNFTPINYTTTVAPKNLEGSSNNGALFVKVFDANGLPVVGANVHVVNASSSITIDDVTNAQGMLQIVDTPPGVNAYAVSVTKTGYSLSQTYPIGSTTNPNPITPPATVATQTVTALSLAIDKVSTLNIVSETNTCAPVGSFDFSIAGSKLIGTTPNVLKYPTINQITNSGGLLTLSNLEWDNYTLTPIDAAYDVAGSVPYSPLSLNPNTTQSLQFTVVPKSGNALMVTVLDSGTGNTVTDATTTIVNGGFSATKITGRGTLTQTDWSGGSGQELIGGVTQFYDQDGNIVANSPAGDLKLLNVFGNYVSSGYLTSSAFDTGAASNFHELVWQPTAQPASTTVRLQVATADTASSSTVWNFLGPDGTSGTYYTMSGTNISNVHNGNRYLRYRVYLDSATTTATPDVSDVSFTSTSSCVPAGQVLFQGLSTGTYTLTVDAAGYLPYTANVSVGAGWQEYQATVSP